MRPPAAQKAGVVVRLMRPQEQDDVASVLLGAYEADYELPADYRADIADVAGRARSLDVWVAVDGASGAMLGSVTTPRLGESISAEALDEEMDLRLLGVSPAARGRGVATTLMEHVIDLARARGARSVMLSTGPDMAGAHRLYERLGFVRAPERDFDIVDGVRLFVYALALS